MQQHSISSCPPTTTTPARLPISSPRPSQRCRLPAAHPGPLLRVVFAAGWQGFSPLVWHPPPPPSSVSIDSIVRGYEVSSLPFVLLILRPVFFFLCCELLRPQPGLRFSPLPSPVPVLAVYQTLCTGASLSSACNATPTTIRFLARPGSLFSCYPSSNGVRFQRTTHHPFEPAFPSSPSALLFQSCCPYLPSPSNSIFHQELPLSSPFVPVARAPSPALVSSLSHPPPYLFSFPTLGEKGT